MNITLDKIENEYYENGKHYVKASMLADDTAVPLPENGSTVKGLNANDYFAPGSSIFTVTGSLILRGSTAWGDWL